MSNSQKGFGLVETLLTLGALSALSLGIYMVLSPTSANAKAKVEQDNLRDLSTAVDRSFGLLGNFQAVSASRLLEDGLAPTRMVDGTTLRTAWGTAVDIVPHAVNAPADGFLVVYPFAPSDVCPRLAAAVSRDVYDLGVDGVSMFDNGQLNVAATAAACGARDTATMEFVYHSGLVAGTAVAAPPLVLPPANPTVSRPTSPPLGGSVGPAGPVGPAAPVGPVGTAPPVSPPPSVLPPTAPPTPVTTTTPPSVTPPPATPPTTVTACVVPPNTVENQNLHCAAGNYGTIAQTRFATWSCPEAWDMPVQGVFSGWTTTSTTCQACPSPSTQSDTQWVFTPSACAAAQYGTRNWEREQSRSRGVSYNCPVGTTTLPAPTYGAWSAWSDTGNTRSQVNTCANCPSPSTQSETQWIATNAACAAGSYGGMAWEREQARSRSVSYNCPAGTTTLPPATVGGWSTWSDTGTTRNAIGSCVSCPAPVPQTDTQWVPASAACPSGQAGTHTWEAEQTRTRTGSYSCPAGTTVLPPVAFGGWSAWANTGARRGEVNTCAPAVCDGPLVPVTAGDTDVRVDFIGLCFYPMRSDWQSYYGFSIPHNADGPSCTTYNGSGAIPSVLSEGTGWAIMSPTTCSSCTNMNKFVFTAGGVTETFYVLSPMGTGQLEFEVGGRTIVMDKIMAYQSGGPGGRSGGEMRIWNISKKSCP